MDDKDFRAKQFMPFDALKGFYELIDSEKIVINPKKELSDDMESALNDKLKKLLKGDKVIVKHYYNMDYIETFGFVKKIDYIYKKLYIMNSAIKFEDILSIEKI